MNEKIEYLSFNKIISYNCPVNIIITERGFGKSFQSKQFVINQYLKHNNEFLYLRRYENELKQIFENSNKSRDFFSDIQFQYNQELKGKNKKFYCDKNIFGYAKRFTESQDLKSSNFSKVTTIIIDEYFIEKNRHRQYLPNEIMIILNIIDSVIRNRNNIRIFILGNAVEDIEYSPLFQFFNLFLPYNNEIKLFKDNLILLYYANSEKFREQRKQTLIGKLASGTAYEEYAINNKILNKNNDFIDKKDKNANFIFSFIYKNNIFGVWVDYRKGKIYISNDYNLQKGFHFTFTTEDFRPNTLLLKSYSKNKQIKFLIDNYKMSNVYFENQNIKKFAQDAFKLFL